MDDAALQSQMINDVVAAALLPAEHVREAIAGLRQDWDASVAPVSATLADTAPSVFGHLMDPRRGNRLSGSKPIVVGVTVVHCADHALTLAATITSGRSATTVLADVTAEVGADQRDRQKLATLLGRRNPGADRRQCMTSLTERLRVTLIDIAVLALHTALATVPAAHRKDHAARWAADVTRALRQDWPRR